MSETTLIYKSGALSVSNTMLRFKGRRYKLEHIENLILKRPLFYIGLGLGVLVMCFVMINADLLYWHELIMLGSIGLALPAASWPFGTLTMHSRTLSTNEGSITWFYNDLAKAQDAVESVLEQQEKRHKNML